MVGATSSCQVITSLIPPILSHRLGVKRDYPVSCSSQGEWINECLEEEEDLRWEEPDHHRRFRRDLRGFRKSDAGRLHLETLSFTGASRAQAVDDDYEIEESCFEEGGFTGSSSSSSSETHQFQQGSKDERNARGGRNTSSTIKWFAYAGYGADDTVLSLGPRGTGGASTLRSS